MKLKLTQADSRFVVRINPREIVAIMATENATRLRMENGVEITVNETAKQINQMMRGKS